MLVSYLGPNSTLNHIPNIGPQVAVRPAASGEYGTVKDSLGNWVVIADKYCFHPGTWVEVKHPTHVEYYVNEAKVPTSDWRTKGIFGFVTGKDKDLVEPVKTEYHNPETGLPNQSDTEAALAEMLAADPDEETTTFDQTEEE